MAQPFSTGGSGLEGERCVDVHAPPHGVERGPELLRVPEHLDHPERPAVQQGSAHDRHGRITGKRLAKELLYLHKLIGKEHAFSRSEGRSLGDHVAASSRRQQ